MDSELLEKPESHGRDDATVYEIKARTFVSQSTQVCQRSNTENGAPEEEEDIQSGQSKYVQSKSEKEVKTDDSSLLKKSCKSNKVERRVKHEAVRNI